MRGVTFLRFVLHGSGALRRVQATSRISWQSNCFHAGPGPGFIRTGKFGLFAAHPEIDGTSNNIERVKISIHWMVNAKKIRILNHKKNRPVLNYKKQHDWKHVCKVVASHGMALVPTDHDGDTTPTNTTNGNESGVYERLSLLYNLGK